MMKRKFCFVAASFQQNRASSARFPCFASGRHPINPLHPGKTAHNVCFHHDRPRITARRPAGHFGPYGGMFVPETLMTALNELTAEYEKAKKEQPLHSREQLSFLPAAEYAARPTPLYSRRTASPANSAARKFTSSARTPSTLARTRSTMPSEQILLAQRMGKKRIIAETGAGQHGVATATVAARAGLE